MRDNKNLNKINLVRQIIGQCTLLLIGLAQIIILVIALLKQYNIINWGFTISNFNWFSVATAIVMIFCFIYFPIRNLIYYSKIIKKKQYNKEFGTITISSQKTPINLVDVENEHNRDLKSSTKENMIIISNEKLDKLKSNTKTKQVVTKPNTALIKFLSVMVGIFVIFAILCFINAIIPEPWMTVTLNGKQINGRNSWKVGLLILCFLPPFILWLSSLLKTHFAIKYNKPIKKSPFSHYFFAYCVLIPLGIAPYILINDSAKFKEPLGIFYMSFWVFFFALITYGCLHDVVNYKLNKKLLCSKTAIKNKAKYVGCKYSNSTSQNINGVPTRLNVKYKVKFSYIDENGIQRIKTSTEEYTFKEVAYLKYKREFDILSRKKRAVIVEDLTNIEIPTNVNINIEQKNSKTFLPSFARKNRWLLTLILSLVMVSILEVAGIGMLVNPAGSNISGIACIIIGFAFLGWSIYYSVPSILAEYKGKETYGKLLKLQVDHKIRRDHETNRKYAVIDLNGKVKNIYLLYDEWYSVLGEYVGKEIPLKVFKKTAVIDFQKIYSDLI